MREREREQAHEEQDAADYISFDQATQIIITTMNFFVNKIMNKYGCLLTYSYWTHIPLFFTPTLERICSTLC